jgi:hypothetical protein
MSSSALIKEMADRSHQELMEDLMTQQEMVDENIPAPVDEQKAQTDEVIPEVDAPSQLADIEDVDDDVPVDESKLTTGASVDTDIAGDVAQNAKVDSSIYDADDSEPTATEMETELDASPDDLVALDGEVSGMEAQNVFLEDAEGSEDEEETLQTKATNTAPPASSSTTTTTSSSSSSSSSEVVTSSSEVVTSSSSVVTSSPIITTTTSVVESSIPTVITSTETTSSGGNSTVVVDSSNSTKTFSQDSRLKTGAGGKYESVRWRKWKLGSKKKEKEPMPAFRYGFKRVIDWKILNIPELNKT